MLKRDRSSAPLWLASCAPEASLPPPPPPAVAGMLRRSNAGTAPSPTPLPRPPPPPPLLLVLACLGVKREPPRACSGPPVEADGWWWPAGPAVGLWPTGEALERESCVRASWSVAGKAVVVELAAWRGSGSPPPSPAPLSPLRARRCSCCWCCGCCCGCCCWCCTCAGVRVQEQALSARVRRVRDLRVCETLSTPAGGARPPSGHRAPAARSTARTRTTTRHPLRKRCSGASRAVVAWPTSEPRSSCARSVTGSSSPVCCCCCCCCQVRRQLEVLPRCGFRVLMSCRNAPGRARLPSSDAWPSG